MVVFEVCGGLGAVDVAAFMIAVRRKGLDVYRVTGAVGPLQYKRDRPVWRIGRDAAGQFQQNSVCDRQR